MGKFNLDPTEFVVPKENKDKKEPVQEEKKPEADDPDYRRHRGRAGRRDSRNPAAGTEARDGIETRGINVSFPDGYAGARIFPHTGYDRGADQCPHPDTGPADDREPGTNRYPDAGANRHPGTHRNADTGADRYPGADRNPCAGR